MRRILCSPVLSNDAAGRADDSRQGRPHLRQLAAAAGGDDHAGDDMIVVTDFQDNLDKARKILKEVDRRPQQVLVEATILRATSEREQLARRGLHRPGRGQLLDLGRAVSIGGRPVVDRQHGRSIDRHRPNASRR